MRAAASLVYALIIWFRARVDWANSGLFLVVVVDWSLNSFINWMSSIKWNELINQPTRNPQPEFGQSFFMKPIKHSINNESIFNWMQIVVWRAVNAFRIDSLIEWLASLRLLVYASSNWLHNSPIIRHFIHSPVNPRQLLAPAAIFSWRIHYSFSQFASI